MTTPYIYTRSGRRLNPLDPDPAVLDICDIAHALSLCNRFAGHTTEPISVAQHSVYVARLVQHRLWVNCGRCQGEGAVYDLDVALSGDNGRITCSSCGGKKGTGGGQGWILQGLLHDGSEFCLGDVTKWLKGTPEFAPYRAAEAHVQAVIYRWAGLPAEDHPAVEWADRVMVRYEMMRGWADVEAVTGNGPVTVGHLRPDRDKDYPPLTPEELAAIGSWEFWGWRRAKMEFLQLWEELTAARNQVAATV